MSQQVARKCIYIRAVSVRGERTAARDQITQCDPW